MSADRSLGDGMVIAARIRARLLGLPLLDLKADVAVTPVAPSHPRRVRAARIAARHGNSNGRPIGGGLPEVARALEASETELGAARRGMP